jgi:hypothetical protein
MQEPSLQRIAGALWKLSVKASLIFCRWRGTPDATADHAAMKCHRPRDGHGFVLPEDAGLKP